MMKFSIFLFISCSFLLFTTPFVAQLEASHTKLDLIPFSRKVFIENRRQFKEYEEYNDIDKQNLKFCIDKDYKVFFYPNKITYKLTKIRFIDKHSVEGKGKKKEERRVVKTQQIEVEWLNSNTNVEIIPSNLSAAKYTYAGKNQTNETFFYSCKGFEKLTYKNIYDNIDIEYAFHPEKGIKYNIILHPGANINDIQLKYKGSNPILQNGNIILTTINGDIVEKSPASFYQDNKIAILSNYSLKSNILSFNLANFNLNKTVIIDPWVIAPTVTTKALDNGVDNIGNIYLYGSTRVVEKHDGMGNLIWSLTPGIDRVYYGDLLVESSGNFYLCEGYVGSGAHTYRYDPTSALIWQSTSNGSFREHWRLAINCVTQKVIVAGGGTTSPTLNIAEIAINTGVLVNAKSVYSGSQSDVAGLAVDQLGKSYLKHSNPNIVTFTDNLNNTLANVNDGYGYSEIGGSYNSPNSNGYNLMALDNNFLYTSDGVTIKKWDITAHTIIASTTIPGSPRMASGILADKCNNLFVGGASGVYRFDFNLVQQEFHPTPSPVFDIAFSATNADIITCGNGYLTNLPFGRISCASANKVVSIDSCYTSVNTIEIHPTLGLAPFTFLWDDGNTDSVRINLIPGTYKITIKDASCVPSFIFDSVVIPEKLFIATIDFDTVCFSSPTNFTGNCPQPTGTTNTWAWDFTDNNTTSTSQNPTYIFSNNGTYNVSLIVTNSNGCIDTTQRDVLVYATPQSIFNVGDTCFQFTSVFNNTSTINLPDSITAFNWDFGDGSTSTLQNPFQTYANSGLFPVKLVTTSDKGCKDSTIINTTIFPKPITKFGVNGGCVTSINHSDSSSVSSGNIISWEWDFGNGSTSTLQNPSHVYSLDVNVTPILVITTDNGCKDTSSRTTIMNAFPSANFSYIPDCLYDSISFTNHSTIASSSSISSYIWNFEDNTSFSSIENPNHLYNQEGTYNVNLIASSNNGCVKDTTIIIEVYPKPIANFSSTTVCENFDVTSFTNLSTVITGSITDFSWNFDYLANISILPNPTFNYSLPDTYNVTLIVTTNYNCKDTIVLPVIVTPKPTAGLLANRLNGCSPVCVDFTDNSTTPNTTNVVAWDWNFNNGEISLSPSPSICFINNNNNEDMTFTISLVVTNDLGCKDTVTNFDLITSWHNPIASFTPSPEETTMYESEITTINNSVGATIYFWDFNNGQNSTLFEPTIIYGDTGTYNIMLAVETSNNCVDTTYNSVIIKPVFSIYIPNTFTPNNDGNNDGFLYKGYGIDENTVQFYIFDRWGTLIYYTEGSNPWDGTYKGELVKQDMYVYKFICNDVLGESHEYIGHINLLK